MFTILNYKPRRLSDAATDGLAPEVISQRGNAECGVKQSSCMVNAQLHLWGNLRLRVLRVPQGSSGFSNLLIIGPVSSNTTYMLQIPSLSG
jgi:hypothetical protein